MQVWTDNTGLHAVRQCLNGKADNDGDIRGLLQFATLLIYGDRMQVNGFEIPVISERTEELVHALALMTPNQTLLEIAPITAQEYAEACTAAADRAASDLPFVFNPDEHIHLRLGPPDLPRELLDRQVNCVRLACLTDESDELSAIRQHALADRAVGAVDYMFATSAGLRRAVSTMVSAHAQWTDQHSYQLNVFLRYQLNDQLGACRSAIYAPAVGRAELIHKRHKFVTEALVGELDDVLTELRGTPLGIPSVSAALVSRSKGEPKAILVESLEMRERARSIRQWLSHLVDRSVRRNERFELMSQIRSLGADLRKDLALDSAPRFLDAVDVTFIVGLPAPSVSAVKLFEWMQYNRGRKQRALLTDIVKSAAYYDSFPRDYSRLASACSRNRDR
jgi:hypothetical protein